MGWARGSQLAEELWEKIKVHIKPESLEIVAKTITSNFEDYDADDWDSASDLWKASRKDNE